MTRAGRYAPLLAVVLAGCLASKNDVVLLQSTMQTEFRTMRDQSAQAAAAERAHIDQVLAQISRENDSVRALSVRLAKLQSDMQNDHYEMGRQLLQIQELTGQSQRRIQELRASLEDRAQAAGSTAPPDSAHPAPGGPGPAQLFQSAYDQLRRGSTATARSGFEELLRTYPTYEDAPEAMVYIAETYAAERNQVAADSVYGLVIKQFPKSPKTATALYKQGLSLQAAGKTAAARAAFDRIVKEFPRSDEAELAKARLRSLGK
ncbi:MAG: tetratricopeptide repeat protein [bacterium]